MWSVLQIMLESDEEAERLELAARRLGLSATRYYQVTNVLLTIPAAWAAAPIQLEVHQRQQLARRRWRTRPGAASSPT